jgi:hypothetical protein
LYKRGVFYLASWYPEDSENHFIPRRIIFKIRGK